LAHGRWFHTRGVEGASAKRFVRQDPFVSEKPMHFGEVQSFERWVHIGLKVMLPQRTSTVGVGSFVEELVEEIHLFGNTRLQEFLESCITLVEVARVEV
jgi:hypothetical protein